MIKLKLLHIIENNSFTKFLLLFGLITILSLSLLSIITIKNVKDNYVITEQENIEDFLLYLKTEIYDNYLFSGNIVNEIISTKILNNQLCTLLNEGYNDYYAHLLDEFSNSEKTTIFSVDKWLARLLARTSHLEKIMIFSKRGNVCYNITETGFRFDKSNEKSLLILKNKKIEIKTSIWKDDDNDLCLLYSFPIKRLNTYEAIGEIVFFFSFSDNPYKIDLNENSTRITVECEDVNLRIFPNDIESDKKIKKEISQIAVLNSKYVIKSYNKFELKYIAKSIFFIVGITVIIIGIAILMCYLTLRKFFRRIKLLLHGMDEVKKGNLKHQIEVGNSNDEIAVISDVFNEMCKELYEHIDLYYKANINQKNAELKALQNQIQPHFLYNTLEALRMKAVCDGNKELGKMIYNLGSLFRHQMNSSMFSSVQKEICFCISYLNLYQMRFNKSLTIINNIPKELNNKKILKLSLQPLVENYMKHGFDQGRSDNKIEFDGELLENGYIIKIKDNGNKLSEGEIAAINDNLKSNTSNNNSIGLFNVNERLKFAFGKSSYLKLNLNKTNDLTVKIYISNKKV